MPNNFLDSVSIQARLNDVNFNCLIDSGAGVSLVTKGIVKKLGISKLQPPDKILKDASGNKIEMVGKTILRVKLRGENGDVVTKETEFYVSDSENMNCVLLGRNFMKSFGTTTFDFVHNKIKLGDVWFKGLQLDESRVKLVNRVTVPANSEKFVRVKCKGGNNLAQGDFLPVSHVTAGVYAAKARVIPNSSSEFQVSIINTNDVEIKLPNRQYMGKIFPCFETISVVDTDTKGNHFDLEKITIGKNVPVNERKRILEVLKQYEHVFAQNTKKPNVVTHASHKIKTSDTSPVFRKPFPTPYAQEKEVDDQVREML